MGAPLRTGAQPLAMAAGAARTRDLCQALLLGLCALKRAMHASSKALR
jgi:hypothetical protein